MLDCQIVRIPRNSDPSHYNCTNISLSMPLCLMQGCKTVQLHVGTTEYIIPSNTLCTRSANAPLYESDYYGFKLNMFRNRDKLVAHLHIPVEHKQFNCERILYSFMTELRTLRAPHDFKYTTNLPRHLTYFEIQLVYALEKLRFFGQISDICLFPPSEEHNIPYARPLQSYCQVHEPDTGEQPITMQWQGINKLISENSLGNKAAQASICPLSVSEHSDSPLQTMDE